MTRIKAAVALAVAVALVAACSSSKPKTARSSTPPGHRTSSAASSSAASSSAASSSAAVSGLSGTWDGHYSGTFSGTFTLMWTQTGSDLAGTIKLSAPANATLPIHGTLSNGNINFGTVGSTKITYTGVVSGNSMSGHWNLAGPAGASGTWSATKM